MRRPSETQSPAPTAGEATGTAAESKAKAATDGAAEVEEKSAPAEVGGFWASVNDLLHSGMHGPDD